MFQSIPTIDHIVVSSRDQIDAAIAYERLGFTLTARGFHRLGPANHLATFGTDDLKPPHAARDATLGCVLELVE